MRSNFLLICFLSGILLTFCAGCPDYSHLRPEPDYENMTDGGSELDESEADDQDSSI